MTQIEFWLQILVLHDTISNELDERTEEARAKQGLAVQGMSWTPEPRFWVWIHQMLDRLESNG